MVYKMVVLVFAISVLMSCNQNGASSTNNTKETVATGELLSTVCQVSADNEVEVQFDNATRKLSVLVNGKECNSTLNLPDSDFLEVYEAAIEVDDYNFDGYNDFALVGGYRNIQYFINLFDPQSAQFVPFTSLDNLNVNAENKQLISNSIKSAGEHSTDVYGIYGFNDLVPIKHVDESAYGGFFEIDNGAIGNLEIIRDTRWFNHSATEVKEMELLSAEDMPATYVTKGKRLYLYNSPKASGKTSMYLVEGDKMELLDIVEGFFKIKFVNPKYGDIVKWIKYSKGNEQ